MLSDHFRTRYQSVPMTVFIQRDRRHADAMPHNHMEFEILLLTGGCAQIYIDDRMFLAEEGDMVFINPLEVHHFTVEEGSSFSNICCCFDCSMILKKSLGEELKSEQLRITNLVKADEPEAEQLRAHYLHLIEVYQADGAYVDMEAVAHLSLLFSWLLNHQYAGQPEKISKNDLFCSRVLQYISQKFTEQITSADAARYFSYDQCYFCRAFKKNFGMNFSDYLNRYRVISSRELLEKGEMTITEIAGSCGFRTATHYSECFRKYLGILPSRYKKVKMV